MVVLLVLPEMIREVVDALRQQRDLDLGRTGVTVVLAVLIDDGFGVFHSRTRIARGRGTHGV